MAIAEDAHSASTVKFGPLQLKKLATRPLITLVKRPGFVSSLFSAYLCCNEDSSLSVIDEIFPVHGALLIKLFLCLI